MKKFLIVLLFAIPLMSLGQNDPSANPTDCAQAFFKAMLNEDATLMSNLLADDAMIVNFDGFTAEKDLIIQGVGGGYVVVEKGENSNLKTRTYNDNTAVVTGNWKAKGNIQGNSFDNEVVFALVCVKKAGNWQVSHIQFTPLK